MMDSSMRPRRLIILGATGSIGVNTLDVVRHLNAAADSTGKPPIEVVGLAAGRNASLLVEQANRFGVCHLAVADAEAARRVQLELPHTTVLSGPDAALRLVEQVRASDLVAAIVGSAGLPATVAAIRKGMRIGLANKETLVAAGPLVAPLVRRHGAELIPIDSEHSALFQCMECQRGADGAMNREAVRRIVLTASGGPFRTFPRPAIENATVEQALNHPTWDMGPKITIDSATMMNKALEIIEAHWLFDLPASQIEVIIHPQSMVHSFLEFRDHSILAQLGPPDMRTPIQYALTYPDRPAGCSKALDWTTLSKLDFESPDPVRFPALSLAYEVIEAGGSAGAIFNAANETAVAAFLEHRIRFGRIVELVAEALSAVPATPIDNLETVMEGDRQARAFIHERIKRSTRVATTGRPARHQMG